MRKKPIMLLQSNHDRTYFIPNTSLFNTASASTRNEYNYWIRISHPITSTFTTQKYMKC